MKNLLLALLILVCIFANSFSPARAQGVGINTDNSSADTSAILDVKATDKGLLVPRMTHAEPDLIALPANGLLIYQTDDITGFYFFNGSAWTLLHSAITAWGTRGNARSDLATNFIGTTNAQPLRFRVNNTWAGQIDNSISNTSIGLNAFNAIATGGFNIAIGTEVLRSNTTGLSNVATGFQTLQSNTTGAYNVAIGANVLQNQAL